MSIPGRVEAILQKMLSVARGKEMRPLIHDAFECLYEDAGNLAEKNTAAANTAYTAATRADTAANNAIIAKDITNTATTNANVAAANAEATRQDITKRLAAGEFKGEKGNTGNTGPQGASGVMVPTSGMFSLYLDPATGNLYADYQTGGTPPAFEYDATTGDLYYVTG